MGKGHHHIGDFLPPAELEKFMETFTVGSALGGSSVAHGEKLYFPASFFQFSLWVVHLNNNNSEIFPFCV